MYAFITILIVIVCVLLCCVVLIQNPKGGGLSATFGGVGQQLLGARRSTDVVEKATWVLAGILIFLCLSSAFFVDKRALNKREQAPKSEIEKNMPGQPYQQPANNAPAQQRPAGPQPQGGK